MTKYDSYEYKPTFETLMQLLETGREIEFTYKHNEYFIINSNKHGRALILDTEDLSDYTHDINKFVEMAKIYGITLKELFTNHSDEIEFGTIF